MDFKDKINRLGFNSQNGLHIFGENTWKNKFPRRVEEVIDQKIKPDAIYDYNGEPFILFFKNPQKEEIHKWCWNLNSSPLIIIHDEDQLKIYNGFAIDNRKKFLKLLVDNELEKDDFRYLDIVSGKFLEKYKKES